MLLSNIYVYIYANMEVDSEVNAEWRQSLSRNLQAYINTRSIPAIEHFLGINIA